MKIGIVGLGFVGSALYKSFKLKNIDVVSYDKYKKYIDNFEVLIDTDIVFLALPTPFSYEKNEYNKSAIYEVCELLEKNNYIGLVVIKSTIEPETTNKLSEIYKTLRIVHNPEFLSASTAFDDFHNQKHIVIGISNNVDNVDILVDFYRKNYNTAEISLCKSIESESMKFFLNSFYAVKIQFFNELFLLCKKNNSDYETIRKLMIKNNWINPMHTMVPGNDGKLSYGGYCFPKDTNALLQYMINKEVTNEVLSATIKERNCMRDDNSNVL